MDDLHTEHTLTTFTTCNFELLKLYILNAHSSLKYLHLLIKNVTNMEKLIKIQSVIMMIEELQGLKTEYKTIFNYKDENHLEIECFSKPQTMAIMQILGESEETAWYFLSNSKIEIIDLTKYK